MYEYDTVAEGVLIPWPEAGFEQRKNVTTYGSGVVAYDYSCHWTTVTEVNRTTWFIMTADTLSGGIGWIPWSDGDVQPIPDTGTLTSKKIFYVDIEISMYRGHNRVSRFHRPPYFVNCSIIFGQLHPHGS